MPPPPQRTKGRSPRSPINLLLLAVGVALSLVVAEAISASRREGGADRQTANRPVQVSTDGYVSSKRCQACHPSQYDSWYGSFHRTMTQLATPETVVADFRGTQVDDVHGRPMRLDRRDAQFWAEFDDPDWNGEGSARRISGQVVMMTGSHHQQVYWYRTDRGRQVGQLPGTYLIDEGRWIPRRMVFLRPPVPWPPSSTGLWNGLCINCHATHGKPEVDITGAGGADTNVGEFGIACEACHGPGEEHARANQSPLRRYSLHLLGRPDSTIVQPTLLDPKASSQVCGQCHGVWAHKSPELERRANVDGLSFRPGEDVFKNRFFIRPSANGQAAEIQKILASDPDALANVFWSDGMVRVSGREFNGLVDSPCFSRATEPARTLSCASCHTMHKAPSDPRDMATWAATHQVSVGMDTNEACLKCHEGFRSDLTAHTKHPQGSAGSSCYNCHMPYTSYGLLKALRSHQISSPTVAESVQTGRPNACNACHLDKTLAWTAKYLEEWYGTRTDPLSPDESTIAASVLWSVEGDAGQRALMAWMMSWKPAQEASGNDWMAVYLSGLLDDPYDAVRLIAYRSMRSLPGFEAFKGNFLALPRARQADASAVIGQWRRAWSLGPRRGEDALLLNADGSVRVDVIRRLLQQRNNRPVSLNE